MEASGGGNSGSKRVTRGQLERQQAQALNEEKAEAVKKQNKRIMDSWTNPGKDIGARNIPVNLGEGRIKLESDYVEKKPKLEELPTARCENEAVEEQSEEVLVVVVKEEVDLDEEMNANVSSGDGHVLKGVDVEGTGSVGTESLNGSGNAADKDQHTKERVLVAKDLQLTEPVAPSSDATQDGVVFVEGITSTCYEGHDQSSDESLEDSVQGATSSEAETVLLKREIARLKNLLEGKDARIKHLEKIHAQRELEMKNVTTGGGANSTRGSCLETGTWDAQPATSAVAPEQFEVVANEQLETDARAKKIELFPRVLHLLWDNGDSFEIDKTDILNARLVCSSWSNAITQLKCYYGTLWDLRKYMELALCLSHNGLEEMKSRLNRIWDVSTGNKVSPVEPSHLTVDDSLTPYDSETEVRQCKTLFLEMLGRHGHKFRSYHHGYYFGKKQQQQKCVALLEALWLMPNLERLSLQSRPNRFDSHYQSLETNIWREPNPFPRLPKLMSIKNADCLPLQLIEAVLEVNDQITDLDLNLTTQDFRFGSVCLPNLKRLTFSIWTGTHVAPILLYIKAPVLEELIFEADISSEALAAVERFGNSLQVLSVGTAHSERFPELPQLKKLTWDVTSFHPRTSCESANNLEQLPTAFPKLEHFVLNCCRRCCCNNGTKCKYFSKRKVQHLKHMKKDQILGLWVAMHGYLEEGGC